MYCFSSSKLNHNPYYERILPFLKILYIIDNMPNLFLKEKVKMGVEVLGFKITEDFKVLGLVREIMAEFLGTFYLIFIGCGGISNQDTLVL